MEPSGILHSMARRLQYHWSRSLLAASMVGMSLRRAPKVVIVIIHGDGCAGGCIG